MMQNEQKKLLYYISAMGFSAFDTALYLDTHPDDKEALEYFEHFNKATKQAVNEYSARFTPLSIDMVPECRFWTWASDPWPWEMEG